MLSLRSFSSFATSVASRLATRPDEAERLFLQPSVQSCLKQLVGFEPQVVFKRRPVAKLSSPRYVLMTDSELQISLDRMNKRGRKLLELVPYKAPRTEEGVDVLSKEPELQGYETSNVVFTDISPGANDRNRLIVVREPSGLLRRANREERYRMNETYYPDESRGHEVPRMFQEEHLLPILDRKDYLFVLERACVQFEVDDPEFHRVTSITFDHMDDHQEYEVLRSNRWFGSFVFHLVIQGKIDGLLQHYIDGDRISEAALLVQLYFCIHTERHEELKKLGEVQQIRVSEEERGVRGD